MSFVQSRPWPIVHISLALDFSNLGNDILAIVGVSNNVRVCVQHFASVTPLKDFNIRKKYDWSSAFSSQNKHHLRFIPVRHKSLYVSILKVVPQAVKAEATGNKRKTNDLCSIVSTHI
jgi:hypothetical protein